MSKNRQNIDISIEMMDNLNNYANILTSMAYKGYDKDGNIKKVAKTEALNKILEEFFKDTHLTNDFITLKKPMYFISDNISQNRVTIEAFNDNGDIEEDELYNSFIIHKVPNNLDTFNTEYNKFCYNNQLNRHKGVYIYYQIHDTSKFSIERHILIFDYIAGDEDKEMPQKLTIKPITNIENLGGMIGDYTPSINKLLNDLVKEWNEYPANLYIENEEYNELKEAIKDTDKYQIDDNGVMYLDLSDIMGLHNVLEPLIWHIANKKEYLDKQYEKGDYGAEYNPVKPRLFKIEY